MKIALASLHFPVDLNDSLKHIKEYIKEAAKKGCNIVCFPEAYLPGMRGVGYQVADYSAKELKNARDTVVKWAKSYQIAVILPMEWKENSYLMNVAYVISKDGEIIGKQTKNQLGPSEDRLYHPGYHREIFEVDGMKFGIVICHEGWRYPETVRFAAIHGAQIVFHPHFCGNDWEGKTITSWGNTKSPYYERAMMCRSLENTIYFASVNYALKYQDSATSVISPQGECIAWKQYGREGLLVACIDLEKATGLLAKRFKQDFFEDDDE